VTLWTTDAWFILCTQKIFTYVWKKLYLVFPIPKGSANALMKLAGFSTSNKVKNHWSNMCLKNTSWMLTISHQHKQVEKIKIQPSDGGGKPEYPE